MKIDLAARRREQKLTQAELGDKVGIAQRTIAAYESGERRPSIEVAMRLGEVLGFPWAELYEDAENSGKEEERKDDF